MIQDFSKAETALFCNLNLKVDLALECNQRCTDFCANLLNENISLAIDDFGDYSSRLSFFETYGGKEVKVYKLLWDITRWVMSFHPEPVNLVIISKKVPEAETEFLRVINGLCLRGCDVVLVQLDGDREAALEIFKSKESIIGFTRKFNGKRPSIPSGSSQGVDNDDSTSYGSLETDTDYDTDDDNPPKQNPREAMQQP